MVVKQWRGSPLLGYSLDISVNISKEIWQREREREREMWLSVLEMGCIPDASSYMHSAIYWQIVDTYINFLNVYSNTHLLCTISQTWQWTLWLLQVSNLGIIKKISFNKALCILASNLASDKGDSSRSESLWWKNIKHNGVTSCTSHCQSIPPFQSTFLSSDTSILCSLIFIHETMSVGCNSEMTRQWLTNTFLQWYVIHPKSTV